MFLIVARWRGRRVGGTGERCEKKTNNKTHSSIFFSHPVPRRRKINNRDAETKRITRRSEYRETVNKRTFFESVHVKVVPFEFSVFKCCCSARRPFRNRRARISDCYAIPFFSFFSFIVIQTRTETDNVRVNFLVTFVTDVPVEDGTA